MFNMFTEAGNQEVGKIVATAIELSTVEGPENPTDLALQWAQNELAVLAQNEEFAEAEDTAVWEAVYTMIYM
jgi:hypothetical protein